MKHIVALGLVLAGLVIVPTAALANGPGVFSVPDHRGPSVLAVPHDGRPSVLGVPQRPIPPNQHFDHQGYFSRHRHHVWVQPRWAWNGWHWVWVPGYWSR
jgi:hypothetical protein